MARATTRSLAVVDRPLADRIGARLKSERLRRGLTQTQLAGGRYTKAYISALEHGHAKPSVAALNYLATRLDLDPSTLLAGSTSTWTRLEADLRLASGDWQAAADAYGDLLQEPALAGDTKAELLRGLAEALCRLDRGADALPAAAEAAASFERAGRPADAAQARYWQSFALYQLENGEEARSLLRTILDAARGGLAVEPDLPIRALIALAMNESRDGRPEQALTYLEEARALAGDLDERRRATFLFSLAASYRELGDLEAAITTGHRSLALFRAAGATFEMASLENELALVHLALGDVAQARTFATSAHERFVRLDDRRWLAHVLETEAQIELAAGSAVRALELAREALATSEATENRKAHLSAALSVARAQRATGDGAGAIATLEQAAAVAREYGRRAQLQEVLTELAETVAAQGDMARAYTLTREALQAGRA